mmetsp:Transcript_15612/g.38950  ORF Transcript_15612/g.38950 Transcript_15612/m.38950 type:complete len:1748 (-) Transcript_15612:1933-7176(-)
MNRRPEEEDDGGDGGGCGRGRGRGSTGSNFSLRRRRRRRCCRPHSLGLERNKNNSISNNNNNSSVNLVRYLFLFVPTLVWILSINFILFRPFQHQQEDGEMTASTAPMPSSKARFVVAAVAAAAAATVSDDQGHHRHHRHHYQLLQDEKEQKDSNNEDLIVLDDGGSSSSSGGEGGRRITSTVGGVAAAVEVLTHHHLDNIEDEDVDFHPDTTSAKDGARENSENGVIVAVAVDGTLAGISKKSGKVLWKKQSKEISKTSSKSNPLSSYPSSTSPSASSSSSSLEDDADSFLMQPLVSTTTTTKSASSSNYAAVPSVDGTVFTTSNEMTVSTSVKDLVGRAPFLDPKGRFYVGSRYATAAALDRDTGEILRVIATPSQKNNSNDKNSNTRDDNNNDDSNETENTLPELDGRNVVWIGRVDYQVSVQDARTGMMEAEFSVAEVMSVADMNADAVEKVAWKSSSSSSPSSSSSGSGSGSGGGGATNEAEQNIIHRLGLPASEDPFEALTVAKSIARAMNIGMDDAGDDSSASVPTTLVATPNGNVGFWNYDTDGLSWIADETFDTPIAFAMDSDTGLPVDVDLIPDVPDPTADRQSIVREMERQLQISDQDNDQQASDEQTIVGAMTNGQLFALPLGRKVARTSSLLPGRSSAGSFAHKATIARTSSNHKPQGTVHSVSHLPGRTSSSSSSSAESHHIPQNFESHDAQQYAVETPPPPLSAQKACISSSPSFPGCLVKDRADSHHHQHHSSSSGSYNFIPKSSRSGYKPSSTDVLPNAGRTFGPGPSSSSGSDRHDSMAVMTNNFRSEDGGFYHPEYGYVSPEDLHRAQQQRYAHSRSKNNRRLFWALFSWMGPSLLTAFVIAFELGRRKKLRDEKTTTQDPQLSHQQQIIATAVESRDDDHSKTAHIATSMLDLSSVQNQQMIQQQQQQHVIKVSDEILGYGAQGTVVYKGVLDGRDVAVKRMLKAYHANADREISLLIESDGDPNVVRYFLKEARGDFVYLALELCDLSLHDLIGVLREKRHNFPLQAPPDTPVIESTQRILLQIASGVKHLHSQCRIVHRDLKPANILLAISRRGKKKVKKDDTVFDTFLHDYYDAKISDMGLGKQLRGQSSLGASLVGESSLRGSTAGRATSIGIGPGSVGWQAPEVMALRPTSDMSTRSNDSANTAGYDGQNEVNVLIDASTSPRTSRSVDIFSLGCIFYSVLLPQYSHPFGEWFEREANIMHNKPNLSPLKSVSTEAFYLIQAMLERDPKLRPSARGVCEHPFFWSSHKKLIFLCEVSDRLETECASQSTANASSLAIERGAMEVVGTSWESRLDNALVDNVNKFRTYDYACIRDLLRLVRNKHHHFEELPEDFRQSTIPNQDALLEYFERKFPDLVMHCYNFCRQNLPENDALLSKYEIVPFPKPVIQTRQKISPAFQEITMVKRTDSADDQKMDIFTTDDTVDDDENDGNNLTLQESTAVPDEVDDVGISSTPNVSGTPSLVEETNGKSSSSTAIEPIWYDISTTSSNQQDDIIVWEGSTAAKAFNCRGWSRAQDEWSRRIEPCYKKRDANLKRCMEDPRFRTRLCNHWDNSHGIECPMRRKGKCVFAHGPAELRVKEGKKNRWGRLVDKNGNNKNPWHSGGEDTFGAAQSIEKTRKEEGKWNTNNGKSSKKNGSSSSATPKKKSPNTSKNSERTSVATSNKINTKDKQEGVNAGQITEIDSSMVEIKETAVSEELHSGGSNDKKEKGVNNSEVTENPANE